MLLKFVRNRTSAIMVIYRLYLYFLDLSLRNTSKALCIFTDQKRSYVSVWNWLQRSGSDQVYSEKKSICIYHRRNFYSKANRLETLLSVDCYRTGTSSYSGNLHIWALAILTIKSHLKIHKIISFNQISNYESLRHIISKSKNFKIDLSNFI